MASGASSGPVNASLTAEELALLAEGLAEQKRPTVYLREAIPSLGLPEGSSARVMAISGRSLTVKPRGVDDELPFEAEEVRFTRKPPAPAVRKRAPRKASPAKAPAASTTAAPKATPAPAPKAAAPKVAAPKIPAPKVSAPKIPAPKIPAPTAVAPKAAASDAAVIAPASGAAEVAVVESPKPAPARTTRARRGPATVSVSIEGSADNEWTVTVMRGAKRVGKQTAATAEAVGRAIEALGDETASAEVSGLLNAAREQAEQRVAELARQLEEAQRTLKSLRPVT